MRIQKRLRLPKNEYYTKHLSLMNVFLPVKMTPKEIETLANFMSLRENSGLQMFGSTARKLVMRDMGIKAGGLGNYLRSLQEKGFLIEDEIYKFTILPILYPADKIQNYQFQFIEVNE
jgi:hypothetical protein